MNNDVEKLKNSNLELKEMINNSWNGIAIIDGNGKLAFVNDAFVPMLGYSKPELNSMSIIDLITKEYKESFSNLLKDNKTNSYHTDTNVVCRRKDGKPIYLKVTVSLMLNKKYYVLNAQDITKQISDDEILNIYVISSHTDINGIITDVSDAFCKLSGYSKKELIGKSHSIVKHESSKEEVFKDLWETIICGHEWSGKIKNKKKNGDTFWVDVKIKPIYNKYGDITGFTSLMFDITNELLLDQKVHDQNYKINIMSETIKTISHEWRQPLNVISILAQRLSLELEGNEIVAPLIDKINGSLKALSNTIEEFSTLVEVKGEKEFINLKILIETLIKPYLKLSNFEINIDKNTTLYTYEDRIVTIFNNIVKNAIESFMKNSIQDREIEIFSKEDDEFIYLVLSDNAGGIKNDILGKIFEPYYSTKQEKHGVGLGLYITKNILEMHLNGHIEIINNNKNGTDVNIKISKKEDK